MTVMTVDDGDDGDDGGGAGRDRVSKHCGLRSVRGLPVALELLAGGWEDAMARGDLNVFLLPTGARSWLRMVSQARRSEGEGRGGRARCGR